MPEIEQLLPEAKPVEAATLVDDVAAAARSFTAFDERVCDFVDDLARLLRRDPACRHVPAVAALAFWIRRAGIKRLEEAWVDQARRVDSVSLVPRGVVLHLPPTNVDTLFAYSWLMSALVGNGNIVRISPRAGDGGTPVLQAIERLAPDHPEVAATMSFVRYDHDDTVTELLSQGDVRVIWGGDETVRAIRRIPMNPLGTELAFADRFSMAAFDAMSVLALSDEKMGELVRQFYNDSYWFDQLGCSSPRVVFWRGDTDDCERAQARFVDGLSDRVAVEGYRSPVGAVMQKLVSSATLAADGAASAVQWHNPNLTIATQPAEAPLLREAPGSGMFAFRTIECLEDIVQFVTRRDQTLTVFGFRPDELASLVGRINGRGIDRVVPVGGALRFDRFWDGWDLLDAFARRVAVQGGEETRLAS